MREIKRGNLFPLVKGLYETSSSTNGEKLAQFIYGPSYLSFDYVLYKEQLIIETVYKTYTCATLKKRKIKRYKNHFGYYTYRDIPKDVYYLGVSLCVEDGYSYQIASAEKALCDKLYTISPVKNIKEFEELLFEDLRIDEERFDNLNKEDILKMAPLYHSTNLNFLIKYIKVGKR